MTAIIVFFIVAITILRAKLLKKNGIKAHRGDYFTYFCIVKQIKGYFKASVAALIALLLGLQGTFSECSAQITQHTDTLAERSATTDSLHHRMDSVSISLLTVGPGNEVWSLYGHTAIRYQDRKTGADLAINYGSFSFEQPFFVLRFVFGLTDYEMAIYPMDLFMQVYEEEHRWVLQQTLNLTTQEKQAITNALYENYLPQNRTYRYNYFYDNCTTRARDIILKNLNASSYESDIQWNDNSYREMTHQWTANDRWTQFGNDLLLGLGSDFATKREAALFLPDSVRRDFTHTTLTNPDGTTRPLVSREEWLIQPSAADNSLASADGTSRIAPVLTPRLVLGLLFLAVLALTVYGWRTRRTLWLLDLLLLLFTGLCGLLLLAMVFSQHPTVRVNLQILLLNPLSLFLLYPTVRNERRGLSHRYWQVLACCLLLFFAGAFWQHYAEGMLFLALSLLIRCGANTVFRRRKD